MGLVLHKGKLRHEACGSAPRASSPEFGLEAHGGFPDLPQEAAGRDSFAIAPEAGGGIQRGGMQKAPLESGPDSRGLGLFIFCASLAGGKRDQGHGEGSGVWERAFFFFFCR